MKKNRQSNEVFQNCAKVANLQQLDSSLEIQFQGWQPSIQSNEPFRATI